MLRNLLLFKATILHRAIMDFLWQVVQTLSLNIGSPDRLADQVLPHTKGHTSNPLLKLYFTSQHLVSNNSLYSVVKGVLYSILGPDLLGLTVAV